MTHPIRTRGFTIVELIVVVAIAAILSTIAASTVRNIVKTKRVSGEAQSLVTELTDLRVTAVSRGVPAGLCLRLPSYVNITHAANNDPGGRTQFVKATTATSITSTEAAFTSTDQATYYKLLPTYGATTLQYQSASVSAATVTVVFDSSGIPSAWQGTSCDALDKASVTLPLILGVAQSDGATTPARLQLSADGSAAGLP